MPRHVMAALCILAALLGPARAKTWPSRPITIVVPFPAGSGVDTVARIVGDKLGAALGQPVIVDPHPGANGVIAAMFAARAAPDGYTLFLTTNTTQSAAPSLVKNLPYDPIKDFTPIGRIGYLPFMLVISPKIPVTNLLELIAYAKARPGKLNFASFNSVSLVGMATIAKLAGIEITNVPYKGAPQALTDLLSGDISLMLMDVSTGMPLVHAGSLRALTITTAERSKTTPDIPGAREAGLPNLDINAWNGLFGPAGLPRPIVDRLNGELRKAVADPEVRSRFASIGFDAYSESPEEFEAFLKVELVKWTRWIKDAGIEPE